MMTTPTPLDDLIARPREILTGEQVMAELDQMLADGKGNSAVIKACQDYYREKGKFIHAVCHDLKLKAITCWERVP